MGVLTGGRSLAYPVESIRRAPGGEIRERLGDGEIVLRVDEDGSVFVDAPQTAAVGHAFWFAWHAFHPESEIRPVDPRLPI